MLERIRIARRDGRTGVRQTTESLFEVELLERRQMLAGNVQVFVTTGGDLVINGDSQDNVVEVESKPDGLFSVFGSSGTTVNGQQGGVRLSGVTDDMRINLRSGNNQIELSPDGDSFNVPDVLSIVTGLGDDRVVLRTTNGESINVGTDLRIVTRGGNDTIVVAGDSRPGGPTRADELQHNLTIGDDLILRSGGGSDNVYVGDTQVNDRSSINTGGQSDALDIHLSLFVGRATMNMGNGDDFVDISNSQFDATMVSGAQGTDTNGTVTM